ncbi:DUF4097 family beta strand repeat-containing protein [Mesonia aquimarina]|uniref:hypothetical protein n=1 Tax=Mesonia aquimarina TaxID=1504967 RepID=UPI000EF576A2|nr:hypothetical protein [Mesonia aquimarina]
MKFTICYFFVAFFCIGISSVSFGQKKSVKVFENFSADWVEIDADEVFKITLKTSASNQLKLTVFSEGEYLQDINVHTELQENRLLVSTAYPEILTSGYDKLSAHKVFSVSLVIEIPKSKKILITSNIASVFAKGKYAYFEAELGAGRCELKNFTGNALINTFKGNVYVETSQSNIKATSNHGKVYIPKNNTIGKEIRIKSIYGDILVKNPQ